MSSSGFKYFTLIYNYNPQNFYEGVAENAILFKDF